MIKLGNISHNFNVAEFVNLNYNFTTYKGAKLLAQFNELGHSKEAMTLYNYFEPNPMPSCINEIVKPHFSFLEKLSVAVNLFTPGQYIPYHYDYYTKYKDIFNIEEGNNIWRFILMIEDGAPGQIIEIGDSVFSRWKVGDYFGWKNNEYHAFYNLSTKNRYALQITGVDNGT